MAKENKKPRWLYLLIVPNLILMFVCPILEIVKIKIFDKTNNEFHYNKGAEYAYLIFTLAVLVLNALAFFGCYVFKIQELNFDFRLPVTSCIWVLFPIIYTYFTIKDMGNIPFACPETYHYSSSLIHTACEIRIINFIFMWLYFSSFVLLIVVKWYLRDYERVRNEEAAGSIGREIVEVEKQIEPPKPAVISDIIG
ncbi:hypothetical protein C2G38_2093391 [Gigaspora rosea]|uniref:MARVEL domain-containing protein n=1 Tax=Gigaspora rosea TaxID=44941 RepID=A0A397V2X5_9GLOM|nr:hypothetical protein C2G38_2093391 [Gigaspora rosea]